MKRVLRLLSVLMLLTVAAAGADTLAIVGGTIIDGNGGSPIADGVILIEKRRITAVGGPSLPVPPNATRIPAHGKFVMPGMMDANVHLFYVYVPDKLMRFEDRFEDVILEGAQVALASGVTTVFDTWGPREALTHVRDRINRGDAVGSRVFLAGNIIGLGGPTSDEFYPVARTFLKKSETDRFDARWEQSVGPDLLWMTPEQVRTRVREYIASGHVDFLKYLASGHGDMQLIAFSAEAQRAIVEEGHRAGMTVQAHSTSPESLRMEIEAGADLLQHCDVTGPVPMPESTLALIAKRKIPCAALFTTRRYLTWSDAHGTEPMKTFHRVKDVNDRRLIEAGAVVLLTTDGGVLPPDAAQNPLWESVASADDSATELGQGHFRWLEAAFELGMTPMEALLSATRNIARAYKVDKDLGTLEKGKIADLLILDKNPLERAANYRSVSVVIKEGRVVDREHLPNPRVLTAAPENGTPPTSARAPR